ncbi:MAG: sn-glycerol-3-phosphate ABC transporter ATP-binding protein UgpC [Paracoccaceae bacterium]|nr:sn-glycerol-3-phosphate ABC transporter ATP-binding protein UgpC [Paracoccaceae bacterium]
MVEVILKNVKKAYGSVEVIHGIDLHIEDQEFCVFVGPSGCGKSTLLRMIAGLEDINDGEIWIGDKDVTDLEPVDRGISMVFQTYALYPHMTVRENIQYGLKVSKTPQDEIDRRVADAAKNLQLDDYLDRKPGQLSGGQRQRVAIGRSIVRKPDVFLFDEPLSNLDAELRVYMRIEIARLHNRLDSTMVYVTHDQVEAMTLADKIVVLQAGRIEQVGSPLHLYDDPDNQFVAGFIGSPRMNFLPGKVTAVDGDSTSISVDGANVNITLTQNSPSDGDDVTVGIRPEHLGVDGQGAQITVRPDVTEQMGGVGYMHTYTAQDIHVVAEVKGRIAASATEAEQIALSFDPGQAFVFDGSGGRLR